MGMLERELLQTQVATANCFAADREVQAHRMLEATPWLYRVAGSAHPTVPASVNTQRNQLESLVPTYSISPL